APHSGAGGEVDDLAANPTDFLLVVAPIRTDRGVDGLVEIFQRTGARPTTQRGYLRFLSQICELAGEYLKTRRLRHFATKQSLWEQLESFTTLVHRKLDSRETAYTIANEGRRLIGCDRVTVVLRKGGSYVVEAISGQDTFDNRSNQVRLLRDLARVVSRSGEDLWFDGDAANLAPQVERAVNAYVDESHTKRLAVLPLRQEDPQADEAQQQKTRRENLLGAVVIEQLVDGRQPEGLLQRVDVVRKHSSTALANAQDHESMFLQPLWRAIGKSRVLVTARNLPKTLLAVAAIGGVAAALALIPYDFTVVADGKLMPEVRGKVFASLDGMITEVPVQHGDPVKQGDVVARQRSIDLDAELTRLKGELATTLKELRTVEMRRGLLDRSNTRDVQYDEVIGKQAQLEEILISLRAQSDILEEKRKLLEICSPIDGKVVTWKVKELIEGRPVLKGQRLMEIADPSQAWELEIHLPEARMGHVIERLQALQADSPDAELEVTFILATHPDEKLTGVVKEIHTSAEVEGDKGNTVRMDVAFDQEQLRRLVPDPARDLKVGADVKAKIHCGRASIGYVWFHEVWEFIQSRILFRL
ncbi:MAG: HlyD family efflux transporter periplasmic adaptor subunit, partial [Planctomycetales bacterium]|nr:HlyD family efflux transporter periplasmic adaptor subunit [Planctomycetales bacterium]